MYKTVCRNRLRLLQLYIIFVILKHFWDYILIKFFLNCLAKSLSPVDFCVDKYGMRYILLMLNEITEMYFNLTVLFYMFYSTYKLKLLFWILN